MRIKTEAALPVLLFLLVSAAFIATLPQMSATWNGEITSISEDPGLRLLREAMLLVIIALMVFDRRFWQVLLSDGVLTVLLILGSYTAFQIVHALILGLPLIVALTGLRVFEYLPLALVGLMLGRTSNGQRVITKFATYLRYFVMVEAIFAVRQALWAPPLLGVSILGGGRAFGTFVAPNLFGVTMATCALVFAVAGQQQFRKWIFFTALLTLLSGSRTAILHVVLVIGYQVYAAFRSKDRWIIALPAPALAVGALLLASSTLISGRVTDVMSDGRLALWSQVLSDNVSNPFNLLLGWGLGLGSNTINTVFGPNYFPGQFDSDSLYLFILNSYGLLGLALYLSLICATYRISNHPRKLLVLLFILLAGAPFNVWEYFPQNAMLMLLWGYVLGVKREHVLSRRVDGAHSLSSPNRIFT